MPIPFLQQVAAAETQVATQQVGQVLTAGTQQISNFNFASAGQKVGEALSRAGKTGEVGDFSKVTRELQVMDNGTNYAAVDARTNELLAEIAPTNDVNVPADLAAAKDANRTNEFKVILRAAPVASNIREIVLDVMPRISERRQASYDAFTPLHHPGEIQKYVRTSARTWNITATLISRTAAEASRNLLILNSFRSWVMPFYGEGTAATDPELLGAPPPIITLTAYGNQMIGPVKTVMQSYSWDFTNDVDYIPTLLGEPFPVIIEVGIDLIEAWSPAEYSGFSIQEYYKGNMFDAFSKVPRSAARNTTNQSAPPPVDRSAQAPLTLEQQQALGIARDEAISATQGQITRSGVAAQPQIATQNISTTSTYSGDGQVQDFTFSNEP